MSVQQALFLLDQSREAFYGGAAGGGKSDALLAAALQYVDVPGYKALILRRTYAELDIPGAIMSRAREYLAPTDAHAQDGGKRWIFPSGATLQFGYMQNDADMARYQSAEFQFVAYDELTEFTQEQYEWLFSRQRGTSDVAVPLRMRSASNPGGIGHGWVRRRFVDQATREPGALFFPAKLSDHPDEHFREHYHDSLSKLDEVKRRRLEDGDWDAAEGLAFQITDAHLVPDMHVPGDWDRFESMDFGVSNPTCVLAWAVDYDGNVLVFDSYYQADTLVSEHARAWEAKRQLWYTKLCYADPSMWARNGQVSKWGDPATDVTEFEEHGITGLVQANNKRRPGLVRLRELLECDPRHRFPNWHPRAGELGAPRMYVLADRCPELVIQLRDAPLNEKVVDGHAPGEVIDPQTESSDLHAVAAARYGAMSRPEPSREPEPWEGIPPALRTFDPDEERARWYREWRAAQDRNRGGSRRRTERV